MCWAKINNKKILKYEKQMYFQPKYGSETQWEEKPNEWIVIQDLKYKIK